MVARRASIRNLMVIVAILAVSIRGAILWNRSLLYHNRMRLHGNGAKFFASMIEIVGHDKNTKPMIFPAGDERIRLLSLYEKSLHYEESLAEKYRRAKNLPWNEVAPDPPPPVRW